MHNILQKKTSNCENTIDDEHLLVTINERYTIYPECCWYFLIVMLQPCIHIVLKHLHINNTMYDISSNALIMLYNILYITHS